MSEKKAKLPKTPKTDLIFYHWSPSVNRRSINRIGLDVGRKSLQSDWKPPYICFSDDPWLAWHLSGKMFPDISSWDLWMCNVRSQTSFEHYETLLDTYPDTGRHFIKEYRVYSRVYKRDLVYLASRTSRPSGIFQLGHI